MAKRKKIHDNKKINERLEKEGTPPWDPSTAALEARVASLEREINKLPSGTGLLHTDEAWNGIEYKQAENETVYPRAISPAQIVFGTDRPDSFLSGFGARGSNRAASIDMVVGRMASAQEGDGPKLGDDGTVQVDNSFAADAARIYISQLTNIDKDFHISPGASGVMKGRSGIGIKADGVRIIGREGVKIVTGRMRGVKFGGKNGETNSLGGKLARSPTIELLAGNNAGTREILGGLFNAPEKMEELQGIAKGASTRKAIKDLGDIIDEMWSQLFFFSIFQNIFNANIGATLSAIPGGQAAGAVTSLCSTGITNWTTNPLFQTRTNKNVWEANYLSRMGTWFIESRNVFAT
jgi:hypothetical protein